MHAHVNTSTFALLFCYLRPSPHSRLRRCSFSPSHAYTSFTAASQYLFEKLKRKESLAYINDLGWWLSKIRWSQDENNNVAMWFSQLPNHRCQTPTTRWVASSQYGLQMVIFVDIYEAPAKLDGCTSVERSYKELVEVPGPWVSKLSSQASLRTIDYCWRSIRRWDRCILHNLTPIWVLNSWWIHHCQSHCWE